MLLEDLLLIAEKAPKCKTWNYCDGFGFTGIVRDDETLLMVAADDEAKLTVNQLIKELSQYDPAQKVVLTEEYMWENFEKQDGHYFTYDEKLKSCCYEHNCTDVRVPTEEQFAAYSKLKYVDLGLPVKWATCNLGASAPEEYGDYFAWGELKPKNKYTTDNYRFGSGVPFKKYQSDTKVVVKHLFRANETKTVGDNKSVLDAEDDAAAVQLGGKWHIPTKEQIKELMSNTESTWVSNYNGSGVNGILLTSKSDNSKKLFLPACGFLGNGYSTYASCFVFLLSSSVFSFDDCYSTAFGFNLDAVSVVKCHRAFGFCIRGVFNTFWINNCSVNYHNLKVGVVH